MTVSDTLLFIGVSCRVAAPRSMKMLRPRPRFLGKVQAEYDDEHDGEENFLSSVGRRTSPAPFDCPTALCWILFQGHLSPLLRGAH